MVQRPFYFYSNLTLFLMYQVRRSDPIPIPIPIPSPPPSRFQSEPAQIEPVQHITLSKYSHILPPLLAPPPPRLGGHSPSAQIRAMLYASTQVMRPTLSNRSDLLLVRHERTLLLLLVLARELRLLLRVHRAQVRICPPSSHSTPSANTHITWRHGKTERGGEGGRGGTHSRRGTRRRW